MISQSRSTPVHAPLVGRESPPADLLVRGPHVLDPRGGIDAPHDVLVRGGEIAELGAPGSLAAPAGAEVLDGEGRHLFPGFVDPHVHLRTPGQEHKEDLDSGTRAAAAGGRGARARVEILLVLLARCAQVDVRIDEAGEQVAPLAVEDLGARGRRQRSRRAELGDLPAAHQHIVGRVDAAARIEHVGAAHEQVSGRALAADERRVDGGAARLADHASCGVGSDTTGLGAARPASSS